MKNIAIFILVLATMVSCNQQPSLQKYFVDNKENSDFISLDISPSILRLKSKKLGASDEFNEILNTIKKVNILVLKKKEGEEDFYKSEQKKVSKILKNKQYKQLLKAKHKRGNISIQYIGEENSVDEVIAFASGNKEDAFVVFRLLGDNIDVEKIMKFAQDIRLDNDSESVEKIEDFLKEVF